MKNLLTIREQDINPSAPKIDPIGFSERKAARAVVLDSQNRIYLLNVRSHSYHKLPGGGIEEGENIEIALERELLEEIGCRAKVIKEVGIVIEYRDQFKLKQTSYCYLAKQTGAEQAPAFEESEISEGFEKVMASNIDQAIQTLEKDTPDNYEGMFIRLRDLRLLRAAQPLI